MPILISLAAMVAVGCDMASGGSAHLQGKVTLGGKEIPADATAHITFAPAEKTEKDDAKPATAPIVSGRYDCPNVPLGPVTVRFEITRAVGPKKVSERTGAEYQDIVSLVPATQTTGVRLEVTGDKADQDFAL